MPSAAAIPLALARRTLQSSDLSGKRNTSRPVFTSHERALAKAAWSSSSARLSRDSFLPFASCYLCLQTAIDPVACAQGDIFCRECALSNILAQKKEIKRLEKARDQDERDAREEQARKDAEAQERAIREFELTQAGLEIRSQHKAATPAATRREGNGSPEPAEASSAKKGGKRKFSFDGDEVARIATEERAKARKAIEDEKVRHALSLPSPSQCFLHRDQAAKPTLPSFWTPSLTPSSNKHDALHDIKKKTKTQPVCPAAPDDTPHYYSLHTLVSVHFTEDEKLGENREPQRICPSCKRGLSNAFKAMLAKPCGHVVCKSCVDKFMRPSGHIDPHAPETDPEGIRCYVCDADLRERSRGEKKEKAGKEKIKPGLVEIRSDGTGFSAGGSNQVRKNGVAFQC